MKFLDQIQQLERLDQLIRLKATGSPKELAEKLDVSEGTVYNLMKLMRYLGANIEFCSYRNSYYYEDRFLFKFILCSEQNPDKIIGGEKKLNFFELLQNFCSEPPHLCNVFEQQANGSVTQAYGV
jgi:hypothetical protein